MSFGNDLKTTANSANPWFTVSVGMVCLVVGYGIASMTGSGGTGGTSAPQAVANAVSSAPAAARPAVTGTAPKPGVGPTIGQDSATVTLIEFTDFQCPFCARHHTQTFGQIKTNFVDTGKLKYETRNLPLSFHKFAQISAEAAMCADKQDKYWEMNDLLFAKVSEWGKAVDPKENFKAYAAELGLNAGTFASCLDNGETKADVQKDAADANASGITGTPGFWLIGPGGKTQQLKGAQPYASFEAAINAMLQ